MENQILPINKSKETSDELDPSRLDNLSTKALLRILGVEEELLTVGGDSNNFFKNRDKEDVEYVFKRVKDIYKERVKKLHSDVNHGSNDEETKKINYLYSLIKKRFKKCFQPIVSGNRYIKNDDLSVRDAICPCGCGRSFEQKYDTVTGHVLKKYFEEKCGQKIRCPKALRETVVCVCGCGRSFERPITSKNKKRIYFDSIKCRIKIQNIERAKSVTKEKVTCLCGCGREFERINIGNRRKKQFFENDCIRKYQAALKGPAKKEVYPCACGCGRQIEQMVLVKRHNKRFFSKSCRMKYWNTIYKD